MSRVLVVDDHKLCREGLQAKIDAEPGMAVVAEARDGQEAVTQALEHRPDIVLMDIEMPGTSCFEATRRIQEMLPDTRVIILSGHMNEHHIKEAVSAGAWGYALKNGGFDEVKHAIREVRAGRLHYVPEVMARVSISNGKLTFQTEVRTRSDTLTNREREIWTYLARGMSLKQAGTLMHVSYKTADKHKVNLMRKLDIHDRVELTRYAIREGIVEP
ncbi:MAG: response regulator transcription factor [Planctomycetes bacterium]|nr:response regulator transcription factor [Planctomycetota bacterium]